MRLSHNEAVDSACGRCRAEERPPEDRGDTVDWVQKQDGTREYVCAEHARDLGRFGAAIGELPETPHADPCAGCGTLTLHEDLDVRSRRCPSCEYGNERARERHHGGETMTFEEAVNLVQELVEDEEAVTPEVAAEAVEKMTGVPMRVEGEEIRPDEDAETPDVTEAQAEDIEEELDEDAEDHEE